MVIVMVNKDLEGVSNHWWFDIDCPFGVDSIRNSGTGVVPFAVVVRLPGLTVVVGVLELDGVDSSLWVLGVSSWLHDQAVGLIELFTVQVDCKPLVGIVLSFTVP